MPRGFPGAARCSDGFGTPASLSAPYNAPVNRARPILWSLLVLLGLIASCPGKDRGGEPASPTPVATRPPDVVLILVDALRADHTGYMGLALPATPNLDRLAGEAAWFSRAYAASSWTLPSTVSLLTGKQVWEHRAVRDMDNREHFGRLQATIPTLATTLKERGYRTAGFVNNTLLAPEFGLAQGFDTYDFHGAAPVGHRSAHETVEAATAWLDSGAEPAFLFVHVQEPHEDYDPPAPFAGRFREGLPHAVETPLGEIDIKAMRRNLLPLTDDDKTYIQAVYDEEILATDDAIGQLVRHLRGRDGWDQLELVITADHGEEFWDYGGYEHGHTTRTAVTRVPLLVKIPGAKAGENRSVVGHLDVHALLAGGGDELRSLVTSGAHVKGRTAISEGGLYGPAESSVVTDDLRLVIHLENTPPTADLYAIDETGREVEDLGDDPAQRERAAPLFAELERLRGHLAPADAHEPVSLNPTIIEQLRALGYVD